MNKVGVKPKNFSTKDAYQEYVKNLLTRKDLIATREGSIKNGKILKLPEGVSKDTKDLNLSECSVYISYTLYKKIIAAYNTEVGEQVIKGYSVDLLNGLGYLFIACIERNPNNPRLNKGESFKLRKKLKQEGTLTDHNWKIFYTDDNYIKLKWFRPSYSMTYSKIPNLAFYTFEPAGGQSGKGFRQYMSKQINLNEHLKNLYPYIPYKVTKKK